MCNHSFAPTAEVKVSHNPEICQGSDAALEIAPPDQINSSPISYFQLYVGEQTISSGDEVSICYGQWPNDVFLLFFGFVPEENPHDSYVIFETFEELVEFILFVSTEGVFDSSVHTPKLIQDITTWALQGEILLKRCEQKLQDFKCTLEDDMNLLSMDDLNERLRNAVQFRAGKKLVLQYAIQGLSNTNQ
eukprot:TRINITY_DN7243_c0_g1_i8.p2 TRINITY_DN7243_c0_g1~~TRINITY_DN7243_c0_g1_i8.p2  ORF type:complete len:190 (-),score=27.40 TRINITY_DN7243_c0_g1_i8:166-735(-)